LVTRIACAIVLCLLTTGCETIALTAVGIGGSAALNHTLAGMPDRTFTASVGSVKLAALGALKKMGMKNIYSHRGTDGSETIRATASGRDIEVTLEPLSASSTRMKAVAKNGDWVYDGATAREIIAQTDRLLGSKLSSR